MYLFEDVNKWKEFKCEICKRKFKSWKGLSKHIQQLSKNNPTETHPNLEEYKQQYFPLGYTNGIAPNDRKIYMLCDPLKLGIYNYGNINLLGEYIEINFDYEPFYCGFGKMKERAKYSSSYDDTNNLFRRARILEINENGLNQ